MDVWGENVAALIGEKGMFDLGQLVIQTPWSINNSAEINS